MKVGNHANYYVCSTIINFVIVNRRTIDGYGVLP